MQESRHATEAQRVGSHAQSGPQKGHEIAEGKAEIDDDIAENAELRAPDNTLTKLILRAFQAADHLLIALQCLDKHAILNGFLQDTLHLTVAVTHLTCQTSHLSDVDFTHRNECRKDGNHCQCQPFIHGKEIDKGSDEHGQH